MMEQPAVSTPWTGAALPRDVDLWVLRRHCSVAGCTASVVGCITLEYSPPGLGQSSQRHCFCPEHAADVMRVVGLPFKRKKVPGVKKVV